MVLRYLKPNLHEYELAVPTGVQSFLDVACQLSPRSKEEESVPDSLNVVRIQLLNQRSDLVSAAWLWPVAEAVSESVRLLRISIKKKCWKFKARFITFNDSIMLFGMQKHLME